MRVHLTGASGSGTSTLGRACALALGLPWFDTDDFYWEPTDPPYQRARSVTERLSRLNACLDDQLGWILSGSLCGWGDPLAARFDVVVFLYVEPTLRLARLGERERLRYGERVLPGGDRLDASREFLSWAQQYDTAGPELRSLSLHEVWLGGLGCPVLRLEGGTVEANTSAVEAALGVVSQDHSPIR